MRFQSDNELKLGFKMKKSTFNTLKTNKNNSFLIVN